MLSHTLIYQHQQHQLNDINVISLSQEYFTMRYPEHNYI